jgi:hypothetical protein
MEISADAYKNEPVRYSPFHVVDLEGAINWLPSDEGNRDLLDGFGILPSADARDCGAT